MRRIIVFYEILKCYARNQKMYGNRTEINVLIKSSNYQRELFGLYACCPCISIIFKNNKRFKNFLNI